MIDNGVNPFALDCENKTQYDKLNVSQTIPSGMNHNLFFSTYPLPCTCSVKCPQDLSRAWFYQNGRVVDFQVGNLIGRGSEGAVFTGDFHGTDVAYKLVEIKGLKYKRDVKDNLADLK